VADALVDIESIDPASGDGLARHGRQQVAVPHTIPGERVRIRLNPARTRRRSATLIEVVRPSPHRVSPRCTHFAPANAPPCGGCAWQHIAYDEQLRLKTDLLARLVRAAVPAAPAPQPMRAATPLDDPWHYRHKVHFVFGPLDSARHVDVARGRPLDVARGRPLDVARGRRGDVAMGHYARGSRQVVPVNECPVHDERGNAVAFALRDACLDNGAGRTLKSVAVRTARATSETMATIVVADTNDKRLRTASHAVLAGSAAPTSLHLNVHPKGDAFIFGRDTRRLAGPARVREEIAGVSFLISPTAFFQTNVRAAEILVELALDAIPEGAAVLDLYAGAGLFALPLAQREHHVIAIEESRLAVADGIASRELNRIPEERCRFIAVPVERARLPRADAVVLDPPREGCQARVLNDVFGAIAPKTAVYVSCNPEALARDLAVIVRHGYSVQSIQPVDMFPHTPHVEAVVVLRLRTSGSRSTTHAPRICTIV
jgi:23S rRNA (uracil1939-C5)-methyltransferase